MPNPGIASKERWSEKVAEIARKTCFEHEGVPIALAMAFFDPFEKDSDKQYELTILMNYDPHNPPPGQAMQRLEKALELLMNGAARIMESSMEQDEEMELDEYCASAKWKQ
jgi:hypothetical protein